MQIKSQTVGECFKERNMKGNGEEWGEIWRNEGEIRARRRRKEETEKLAKNEDSNPFIGHPRPSWLCSRAIQSVNLSRSFSWSGLLPGQPMNYSRDFLWQVCWSWTLSPSVHGLVSLWTPSKTWKKCSSTHLTPCQLQERDKQSSPTQLK